jgi:hypothetical protein
MGESFKAVVSLIGIILAIAGALAWIDDRPNSTTWVLRFGLPSLALGVLAFLIALHRRKDLEPDLLARIGKPYFNRDGLAFLATTVVQDGVAFVRIYYQNQNDRPSRGRIAMRPQRGFFLNRPGIDAILAEVTCEPAEFGVATIPIPVPSKLQGKSWKFEVGASVEYPDGKGKRVRYQDGLFLRTNAKFTKGFEAALTVLGAAGGAIVWHSPARIDLPLPQGVSETVPQNFVGTAETLWIPGQPIPEELA